MKIHIVLDETPTPQQLTKGLQVMLMLSGTATMAAAVSALHETFREDIDEEDDAPGSFPAAPPPPPPPPGAGVVVEKDVHNLPHDPRIHSSKATKNKDGSWKAKKNVEPATVAAVTAELRAITGNEAPSGVVHVAPPPPPPPPTTVAPPPPPPTTVAPPVDANAPATDFVGIMQKISGGLANGKLDQAKVQAALGSVGLKQPLDLNGSPHQIPAVNAYLDAVMM